MSHTSIPQEVEEQLALASVDTRFFGKLFMPDVFDAPFNKLHLEIFKLIDSNFQKVVISAPRGIGKTSIIRAFIIREILFQKVKFVVYISHTATLAEMQTENIKNELVGNETIKKLFGDVKVDYVGSGVDDSFSKKSWVAYGNTFVLPRGSGQQVRGLNWRGYRPDLIVVDDLEDKEEVRSQENRYNLRVWFFGDVMKSVNRYSNNWRVVYIDTLKHEDSLLQTLLDSDNWHSTSLSICDENLRSYDPNFITDEELRQEYNDAMQKGVQSTFFMEFMGKVVGGEEASFRPSDFKHYDETDNWFVELVNNNAVENVILWDPGRTTHEGSADTAIEVVGVDLRGNRIFLRDVVARKMHPHEQFDEVFRLARLYNVRVVGVEDAGLHEFITFPFKNEMLKRGQLLEVVQLKPRRGVGEQGKVERVRSLITYYRNGLVYHNTRIASLIETQLLSFPKSKKWDVMDAFAYIVQLLDQGMRYFYPTGGEDEQGYDIEHEYEELNGLDEPPLTYEPVL